jgi:CBS domain containing-hemolysin-like protein
MLPPAFFLKGISMATKNNKSPKLFALKMFIITLIISTGIDLIVELFLADLGIITAIIIVAILIFIGIIFDIIGVGFTSCDHRPFVAMCAKKIKRANRALKLLKNADVVSNVCNDVIGDVCGIVSGAAGAAITLKILLTFEGASSIIIGIGVSSLIASFTVAGKALGKNFALKNNVKIVENVGAFLSLFERNTNGKKSDSKNGKN